MATAPNVAIQSAGRKPSQPEIVTADQTSGSAESDQGLLKNTMTSITKQRVKLNIKVLGVKLGNDQEQTRSDMSKPINSASGQAGEKQTFREQFKAPDMSIVSKLMSKVRFQRTTRSFLFII